MISLPSVVGKGPGLLLRGLQRVAEVIELDVEVESFPRPAVRVTIRPRGQGPPPPSRPWW